MCANCFVEFIHSPPGTPVPAALLEVDDTGNWVVPWPPVSDEEAGAAVPSATTSEAADPQGLLVFSGCEGDLAEKETADAGAVSCSSCEGDFAAGARGMSAAGAKPLSWKWRKKLASLAEGLQLIAGLDLRSDGKLDSPTHAGSTDVSLQRLSESNEEVDQQQDSDSDRDTHFSPLSSPALPADLATNFDRIAQAEFEEAVADGSYVAGPDFEWESEDAREGL